MKVDGFDMVIHSIRRSTDSTDVERPTFEVADIFRNHWPGYLQTRNAAAYQHRTVHDIIRCRTAELGGHRDRCPACGFEQFFYNSCRNRNCPKCQGSAAHKWLQARLGELLPVSYFHLCFSLPHGLNTLIFCNKEVLLDLFFKTVAATIHAFAKDRKRLGAQPGFITVLHTWGQTLAYHVHRHIIIPGGGWDKDAEHWIDRFLGYNFGTPLRRCQKHEAKTKCGSPTEVSATPFATPE